MKNEYDSYNSELSVDNKIKTLLCNTCKQSKPILHKSVDDSVFKCKECIEEDEDEETKLQKSWWRWIFQNYRGII